MARSGGGGGDWTCREHSGSGAHTNANSGDCPGGGPCRGGTPARPAAALVAHNAIGPRCCRRCCCGRSGRGGAGPALAGCRAGADNDPTTAPEPDPATSPSSSGNPSTAANSLAKASPPSATHRTCPRRRPVSAAQRARPADGLWRPVLCGGGAGGRAGLVVAPGAAGVAAVADPGRTPIAPHCPQRDRARPTGFARDAAPWPSAQHLAAPAIERS